MAGSWIKLLSAEQFSDFIWILAFFTSVKQSLSPMLRLILLIVLLSFVPMSALKGDRDLTGREFRNSIFEKISQDQPQSTQSDLDDSAFHQHGRVPVIWCSIFIKRYFFWKFICLLHVSDSRASRLSNGKVHVKGTWSGVVVRPWHSVELNASYGEYVLKSERL